VSGLNPRDMAAALRSFPRRYRGAGVLATPEARRAAAALARAARDLRRVLVEERPNLDFGREAEPADLETAAQRLASEIDRANPTDWNRTGTRGGEEVRALDLAREAVHAGAHELRAAQTPPV